MKYAKLDKNKVIQIQPNKEDGYVEVADNVVAGMIEENGEYIAYKATTLDTTLDLYVADTVQITALEQENINNKALEYLSSTDWYITRLIETTVAVPSDILLAREEARASIVA